MILVLPSTRRMYTGTCTTHTDLSIVTKSHFPIFYVGTPRLPQHVTVRPNIFERIYIELNNTIDLQIAVRDHKSYDSAAPQAGSFRLIV